ncbi:sensor histidine kinase [Phocaeicola sp.]
MPISCAIYLFCYLCTVVFKDLFWKGVKVVTTIYKILLLCVLLMVGTLRPLRAEDTVDGTILIITSYNPETRSISDNLSAFMEEYKQRGSRYSITIENMNCKNLSEAYLWKGRMATILGKYAASVPPSLVILLGQEAWAAYLSQDTELAKKTPAICGLVSSNTVVLPKDSLDLQRWSPESKNIYMDFHDFNIVGGCVYEYDVEKNIKLMRRFYPDTKKVVFISDNTYGGLSMQALVKKEMQKFPELELMLLDGRTESFLEVSEEIRNLSDSTCVMVGTWRIDCTENYVMGNTTYMLRDANPTLPVFTLASVGLGNWALGGFTPVYHIMGKDLADAALDYLDKGADSNVMVKSIPGNYVFDVKRLHEFGLDSINLPGGATLINKTPSFYEQYKYWVIGVVSAFMFLIACFLLAVYYIIRINHLKDNLEKSGQDLLVEKQRAEEANRLKTAFLANMSHEIRTPLNAIVGFSNVLASDESSEEEKLQYCDIIQKNSDLLLHLINDILDISRMESGRIKFMHEECDVVQLCQTALSTAEYARRTSAMYQLETPVASLMLKTDSQRLQQVLINLLSNAGKFTPSGFIRLAFRIKKEQHELEFSVTDTGCGIPADKCERVFERFEKLNEYSQGTGLGLSICKLIVENLGGKIWVDKSYTEGARFVFTHPIE